MSKVSEVMSICLLMIIPALMGYGADQWLGTGFLLTVIGLIFGMTGAVMQLMRLVASLKESDASPHEHSKRNK
ncbi:MAG: AtpZ/AtpI family protein [Mariniblastus sp.]|nr:AtpZ/AtpI family protein [Mariniblastus sp.]